MHKSVRTQDFVKMMNDFDDEVGKKVGTKVGTKVDNKVDIKVDNKMGKKWNCEGSVDTQLHGEAATKNSVEFVETKSNEEKILNSTAEAQINQGSDSCSDTSNDKKNSGVVFSRTK